VRLEGLEGKIREPGERVEPSTLVLLCQNEVGYRNLTRLVSRSYLEGQQRGIATIDPPPLSAEELRACDADPQCEQRQGDDQQDPEGRGLQHRAQYVLSGHARLQVPRVVNAE